MNRTLGTNITGLKFKNNHIVYESFIKCTVKDYEYNLSYNPTLLSGSQGLLIPYSSSVDGDIFYISSEDNYGILKDFTTGSISGSDFSPYVGAVGLYNDAGELLALGKMAAPMPLSSNTDVSFLLKLDTQWVNKPYFTPTPSVTRTPAPTPSVTPSVTLTPTPSPSSVDCTVGTATALYIAPTPSLTPTPSPSRPTAYILTLSLKYEDACANIGSTIPGVTYNGATFCASTLFTSNTFAGYNQSPVYLSDNSGNYISATKINTTTYQALSSCASCPTSLTPATLTFNYSNGYFGFNLSNPVPDPIVIYQAQVKTYTYGGCLFGERLETTANSNTIILPGDTYNIIPCPSNYSTNINDIRSYKRINSLTINNGSTSTINSITLSNGSQIQIGSSLITISIDTSCIAV